MFSLDRALCVFLGKIAIHPEARQVLSDSVDACSGTFDCSEFEFLMTKYEYFLEFERFVVDHINEESDRKSAHDIHRSELWRRAVISATDVKHSDPMSFADKVLSHYDEKFNIK